MCEWAMYKLGSDILFTDQCSYNWSAYSAAQRGFTDRDTSLQLEQ
jgi:hypothetical protein